MLSVCLVVYNEEKMIARCLESIKNIADEIIIVLDGQCSDRTEEICRRYTGNIFIRKHIGFSDPHLPSAFEHAKGDWILRLDADEFLLPEAAGKIKLLMYNKDIDGYYFLWRLWNGKKYITKNGPYKPVLFRKSKLFFIGVPHGIMQSYGKIKKTDIPLEHRPLYNNWSWNVFQAKQLKRIKLHAEFFFEPFENVPKFNFKGKNYPFYIQIRKKLPFFFSIFAIYRFCKDVSTGERNTEALKVSFFRSVYEFLLVYYIFIKTIRK